MKEPPREARDRQAKQAKSYIGSFFVLARRSGVLMSVMGGKRTLPIAAIQVTVLIMRAAFSFFAIALGLTGVAVAIAPDEPKPSVEVCGARETGDAERFLVGSERTARAIFLAVEQDYHPRADKKNFPDVRVRDEDTYWAVFRMRSAKRDRPKDGEIIVYAAGHQLSIRIDKCTAAISNVYFSR